MAAAMFVSAAVATTLLLAPLRDRFYAMEVDVMAVDAALFVGFLIIALRSPRFWPLWVAGLQLTTILGHLIKGVDQDLLPRAYGAALNFWAYPIVLIIGIATWRSQRRRHSRDIEPMLR